jgi:hypothetical protein
LSRQHFLRRKIVSAFSLGYLLDGWQEHKKANSNELAFLPITLGPGSRSEFHRAGI